MIDIDAICRLPHDFRRLGNISIVTLLEPTGFYLDRERLTPSSLERHFEKRPELIEHWIQYSLDQRNAPSWYLIKRSRLFGFITQWEVGLYPDGSHKRFSRKAQACAYFVHQFLEEIKK